MLRKIQSLFERVVFLIEEHPTPVRRYFGLFFALLAVRLCLAFFSRHRLFTLEDLLHIFAQIRITGEQAIVGVVPCRLRMLIASAQMDIAPQ